MYNAEKYIGEAIESIQNQTYKNLEIIIVDDGSSDNSYEIAKKYQNIYFNIILHRQKNQGPGAARNSAFSLSSGEYIQYLDADDLLAPRKIELQVRELLRHDKKTFVFGNVVEFTESISDGKFFNFPFFKNYDNPIELLKDFWSSSGMIATHSFIVSRELIQNCGLWNETWILNEDGEFISRLISESTKAIYLSHSFSYYRKGNTTSLNSTRTERHYISQFDSYDSYYNIYKYKFDKDPSLLMALAKRYSLLIYNMYPNFPSLRKEVEKKLFALGLNKPIIVGSKKFVLLAKLIGFYNALYIQNFFQSYFKKNAK